MNTYGAIFREYSNDLNRFMNSCSLLRGKTQGERKAVRQGPFSFPREITRVDS